ncbi:MAG: hypothetical protein ACOYK9_00695 [Chlamydiia bacterium]
MKWIVTCVLCVFSEFFNPDPDKKAMKALSQKIESKYPALVLRGCGKEEGGGLYLYFQTNSVMDRELVMTLAANLYKSLEEEGVDFSKNFNCSVVFQENQEGDYYQIRLRKEGCQVIKL